MNNMILVVIVGKPTSGKGTIENLLEKMFAHNDKFSFRKFEMGACFRQKAKEDYQIQRIIDSGGLVDDETTEKIFEEALKNLVENNISSEKTNLVIVDGYPRTMHQWDNFYSYCLKNQIPTIGIYVEIDDETVLYRATIRRTCPDCGRSFSIKDTEKCPDCGQIGIVRNDEKNIAERLDKFNTQTLPIIPKLFESFPTISVEGSDTKAAAEIAYDFLDGAVL